MIARMVPEAQLEQTEAGLVPASAGWFVMNARDARWMEQPGRGYNLPLTGVDEHEAETFFSMLGMAIRVIHPGEPSGTYLCAGSRQFQKDGPWGFYCADETAARHNASSPEDTQDGALAYARFPPARPARYREGLLPDGDR
jgi:hypothetical protein